MNRLFKKFRRDIIGLVWLAAGVFIALSLASYNPTDPSFNSIGRNVRALNYCGYFGSFLADLFYQGLGLSAWLLVVVAIRKAAINFLDREGDPSRLRWLWATLLFVTSCALVGLYFPETRFFSGQVPAGGIVGLMVSKGLVGIFNFAGVAVILWTAAAVLVVFYSERTVSELVRTPLDLAKGGASQLTVVPGWISRVSNFLRESLIFSKHATEIPIQVYQSPTADAPRVARFSLRKTLEGEPPVGAPKPETKVAAAVAEGRFEDDEDEADAEEGGPTLSGFLMRRKAPAGAESRNIRRIKKTERIENWSLPKISMLNDPPATEGSVDEREVKAKAKILVDKLAQFSVRGSVVGIKPGPAITLFEFKPAADVKISKITDLADDLSLALSSESVRIIAPIPGRDVVGIETSNQNREAVYLKDILAQEDFWEEEMRLPVVLGRQADGEPKVVDLRRMPHMLVAGSTGSGKSVFVVSLIVGLLFRHSPKTLRLILVDPKQVDLAAFSHCPHLLMPPIREPQKAVSALKWAIREMEKRYRSMSKFGARGLEGFNEIVGKFSKKELEEHETYHAQLEGAARLDDYYYTAQPYIVIVIEEFGDLMAVDKAGVEHVVVRLAQMARACGIHLILAMQSPRKDVVTGLIKTNIPGRVSFKVASKMDSRIILDESGAERLLTRGDMLYLAPGVAKPERHHGAYLSESEIASITKHWEAQGEPDFDPLAMKIIEGSGGGFELGGESFDLEGDDYGDDRYDEILAYVSSLKEVSASLIQRRFRIGYPRAARLIEVFESEGVVGPANGSKPRQVLVGPLKV
ncbi:MAG: DNA translocase FtsK 4TM domain-containing protein [Bdellovibrionales bacterium]|nr:DNA translocase FtsK 4TM domain-containing protein [Bdellovibrionales bacterium]